VSDSAVGQVVMPFYLICDVSGSMWVDLPALNAGIDLLQREIMHDPVVADLTVVSLITFADTASTAMPLTFPSEIQRPPPGSDGLTNYGPAFREFHRAFQADRSRFKGEGKRVFRPCVFFLTAGEPTDGDYARVFASLLGYDPATKRGNAAYPHVTAFGFRDATAETMATIAYPTFGDKRGRYFLARHDASVSGLLAVVAGAIAISVVGSANSVGNGSPQFIPPTDLPGMDADSAR
jgi:uncharacterized protein YegL